MSRHTLSILLCIGSLVLSQAAVAQVHTSSPTVQVVYAVQGNSILTYDIDPQTLTPAQVGTLAVPNAANVYTLVPSPNGHFLYFVADDAQLNRHLWVFATDASGAPIAPATEEIEMNDLFWLTIDPLANYAYLVLSFPSTNSYNNIYIRRYAMDPATGSLSQPIAEAKYHLPNGDGGSEDCWVRIDGFNANATKMYDDVSCGFHGGSAATFYERTLNPQTGALGPDQQVYSWSNTFGGTELVEFVGAHMFDFVIPNDFQQGIDSVNIYPIVPNTSKPVLQCTEQMLQACGSSIGHAHPSGNYVFMQISQDSIQIDRVAWGSKKIVDTGSYIPYWFGQFSPDGTLVYGVNYNLSGYSIQVYGFDTSTSAVTAGGSIWVSPAGPFFAAQRQ